MGERPHGRRHQIQLEYRFDRLLMAKLERVYELSAPQKTTASPDDKKSGGIGLNRPAAIYTRVSWDRQRRIDDRQSDGGAERVRRKSRLSGAGRVWGAKTMATAAPV